MVGSALRLGWLAWYGMGRDGTGWDTHSWVGMVLRPGSYAMHCWKGYQAVVSSMALALLFAVSFAVGIGLFCGWRWIGGFLGCCISGCSLFMPLLGLRPSPACTRARQASYFRYTEYTFTCFVSEDWGVLGSLAPSNQITAIRGPRIRCEARICRKLELELWPHWPQLHPPAAARTRCVGRHEDHPGILLLLLLLRCGHLPSLC